jgi:hypothetical protein
MAYTTPPTFVADDVLEADQLNVLSDDIAYLYGQSLGFVTSACQVSRSTNQALATGIGEYIVFTTENVDIGGYFPGSGDTITVPAGAIPPGATTIALWFGASITYATNGTGTRTARIHVNGSSIGGQSVAAIAGDTTTVYVAGEIAIVEAGDEITLEGTQTSGGPLNVTSGKLQFFRIGVAS